MGEHEFHSGFVALIGRPNVGKSTLINRFIGEKVTIVSDKPQTTRHRIQAVLTRPDAQVVFIDTPGLHKPRHRLGRYMTDVARSTLPDVDIVMFVVDGAAGVTGRDRWVARQLASLTAPIILVVNKMDLVDDDDARPDFSELGNFAHTVYLSALTGRGAEGLVDELIGRLPVGPMYFPEDWMTDRPEQFVMGEFIREQVLHHTEQEVPHSVTVVIDDVRAREERDLIDVRATIFVERDSQKGIVIGRGGRMLKQIGQGARAEIERLLGSQVNLQLWVKAKPGWRDRPGALQELGYN